MNKRRHSLLSDLSFQAILILMFAAILFLSFDHANLPLNGIILCIATLLFMVTYFTSIRIGLVLDIIFVFLLVAFVVFQSVNEGSKIDTNVYFWMIWPIGMIVAISNYVKQNKLLDIENKELVRRVEKYVTIDELTQMNNLLGFERDASIYMNISRRYKLELELVLWRLTYQEDLERLLGAEDMQIAISLISDAIKNCLRKEDLVYLVDKSPYIWGTLLFSKPEAAEIVISHVKESVSMVNLKELTSQKSYSLEISGVVVTYDGTMMTSLTFLNKAKRLLWSGEYLKEPVQQREPVKLEEVMKLEEPVESEEAAGLEELVELEKIEELEAPMELEEIEELEESMRLEEIEELEEAMELQEIEELEEPLEPEEAVELKESMKLEEWKDVVQSEEAKQEESIQPEKLEEQIELAEQIVLGESVENNANYMGTSESKEIVKDSEVTDTDLNFTKKQSGESAQLKNKRIQKNEESIVNQVKKERNNKSNHEEKRNISDSHNTHSHSAFDWMRREKKGSNSTTSSKKSKSNKRNEKRSK